MVGNGEYRYRYHFCVFCVYQYFIYGYLSNVFVLVKNMVKPQNEPC